MLFLCLIYFIPRTFALNEGPTINIEDFFVDSKCIEEPSENFFGHLLLEEQTTNILSSDDVEIKNYRSQVNALAQFYQIPIAYNVINEQGLPHEKLFNVSLKLGDEIYYGSGKNKKLAKEMAARAAMENTSFKKSAIKIEDDKDATPTVVLNNIGAKHGYKIDYYMYNPMTSVRIINLNKIKNKSLFTNQTFWKEVAHLDEVPKSPFNIEVYVGGKSFFGKAHTIQAAKHDAASKAIEYLKAEGMDKESACTTLGEENDCKKAKAELKSPISKIYEYSMSKRLNVAFNLVTQSGPAHKPVFTFECILGPMSTKGVGKSKKEAKRRAAEEMMKNLPELEFVPENLYSDSEQSNKKVKKSKETDGYVADAVNNIINYFSDDQQKDGGVDEMHKKSKDTRSKKGNIQWSPKEKLQEFGSTLNMDIQFQTMQRKDKGYYSLLHLDLNPKYICIGIGGNKEISQEHVSLNALKFLYKLNILEDVDENELNFERFSFDNFIWLAKDSPSE